MPRPLNKYKYYKYFLFCYQWCGYDVIDSDISIFFNKFWRTSGILSYFLNTSLCHIQVPNSLIWNVFSNKIALMFSASIISFVIKSFYDIFFRSWFDSLETSRSTSAVCSIIFGGCNGQLMVQSWWRCYWCKELNWSNNSIIVPIIKTYSRFLFAALFHACYCVISLM